MKIVFFGTPLFSVRILEMLNENFDVQLVVTQPDKPGKRNKMTPSPVKVKALELGLEVFQPISVKNDYQRILDVNADVMVTAAYGQFIPEALLNSFKECINVHGSLLPKHRGGAPIQRAIINGDKETGISIMQMVKKMDSGKVYKMESIPILDTDNNETLFDKLSILGTKLLKETLPLIYDHTLEGIEQDHDKATYSYNLTKEEELIDFNKSSRDIFNQIRGLAMEPGAYFSHNGEVFKVYSSTIVEDSSDNKPGTVLSIKGKLLIKTLDGAISINEIKPQGKKLMDIKSFLNGQRTFNINDVI